VVVKGGLLDTETLGDLSQGGLVVALLREELEGDLDGALSGVRAPRTHRR
jgi:hypothetical protein